MNTPKERVSNRVNKILTEIRELRNINLGDFQLTDVMASNIAETIGIEVDVSLDHLQASNTKFTLGDET